MRKAEQVLLRLRKATEHSSLSVGLAPFSDGKSVSITALLRPSFILVLQTLDGSVKGGMIPYIGHKKQEGTKTLVLPQFLQNKLFLDQFAVRTWPTGAAAWIRHCTARIHHSKVHYLRQSRQHDGRRARSKMFAFSLCSVLCLFALAQASRTCIYAVGDEMATFFS